jgi:hypothetical protein
MANDFNLNEFKLKDPVRNIGDGLQEPIKDSTPGFFQSLKNPIDLWREESLPASLYQWISGNTKKKQTQEAYDYLRNNPDKRGGKFYQEAERIMNRFGYLLDEGPMNIDLKEVGNMMKANPKMFGAELVNMMMADPYLLFMPMGWSALGRGVVNSLRLKYAKSFTMVRSVPKLKAAQQAENIADIKVGAFATLATPFVFSTVWQGSEDRTLDPKRTTIETTIGATAGAVISVGFAGMSAATSRALSVPKIKTDNATTKVLKRNGVEPENLVKKLESGNYKTVEDLLDELKKEVQDLEDPIKFNAVAAEITAAMRPAIETGWDMAVNTAVKASAIGGVVGAAQFLTSEDDKLIATAKGFGAGAAIYGAAKILGRNFGKVDNEIALAGESALDAMKFSTVKINTAAQNLSNKIKEALPDAIDSRRKVFYYITKAKVNRQTFEYDSNLKPISINELTEPEQNVAKTIEKIFQDYNKILGEEGSQLFMNQRANYLPLMWDHYNHRQQPFRFSSEFDKQVAGPSGKFQFNRRGVFADINAGLVKKYKIRPGMDDPAELVRIYGFAASKALATRSLIRHLETHKVNNNALIFRSVKNNIDLKDYEEFIHPYFEGKGAVFVHKGMHRSLRMVFDATEEQAFMGALFTTNLMMKRLAVGFSFFHAGALVESMLFAGNKLNFIKKTLDPRKKPELLEMVNNPNKTITEFPTAIQQLKAAGYDDVARFAQGAGLQITTPEDIGFDRFYYNLRGIDTFLKNHFGISSGGQAEKVFRWFDRITWDRVFTAAKLHTFLQILDSPKLKGVPNTLVIQPGDTIGQIYAKASKAAQFTNDAFGGQNWEQVANRIRTPWVKQLAQTTLRPGSRGYMQLLLFAPDWTISNIRIIAKSLPAFESDEGLRRMYQYYFARAALTYAAAGSALNYIFSGHSILENTDPTRIDLGNGQVLTFSKQLMEPFHWITDPQSTGLKKIGSLPRTTIEVLTNKKYLTTKWSPNITKKDDDAIEKGLSIGGHVGKRFLPIWLQQASASIEQGLLKDGLSLDLAADTSVDFVLGQLGHPRYQGPRYTQYKTKGLVRSPYETLF